MFKISELGAQDVAPLHLKSEAGEPMYFKDADGKEMPVQIFVFGPGSDIYRQAQLRAQRRTLAIAKKGRRALEERTPDERAKDVADLLADITHSVQGLDLEGKPLREAMCELYANPRCGWVASQVNEFGADWANFSRSAPTA